MHIRRLEINVDYYDEDENFIHVFRTDEKIENGETPTTIIINGKYVTGSVCFDHLGNDYNISIMKDQE